MLQLTILSPIMEKGEKEFKAKEFLFSSEIEETQEEVCE